jgi:hypothetical protein
MFVYLGRRTHSCGLWIYAAAIASERPGRCRHLWRRRAHRGWRRCRLFHAPRLGCCSRTARQVLLESTAKRSVLPTASTLPWPGNMNFIISGLQQKTCLKFSANYCLKVHLNHFSKIKKIKKSQNSSNKDFSCYFCLLMEGSRSGSRCVSGSIPLTNGSGSGSKTCVLNPAPDPDY